MNAPELRSVPTYRRELGRLLIEITEADENYSLRYGLVLRALFTAHYAGFKAGIRIDPRETEWPVVYIELPTGQVSWHMPQHLKDWDGHTTPEKFGRIKAYATGEGVYQA